MYWWCTREWWKEEFKQLMKNVGDYPNSRQSWEQLWREFDNHFILTGVAYLWKVPNQQGIITEVFCIPTQNITEFVFTGNYRVSQGQFIVSIPKENILKVKHNPNVAFKSGYSNIEDIND